MAIDMFLKLDGIKGESVDATYKDEIQTLSWSWGMSQSGTTHQGTGAGAGKVSVQDISVTKYIDKSSTTLIMACCKGTHIKEATLIVRKAGDKPLEYVKIKMSDVIVTSVATGGSGGEDRLTENVCLNFAKVEFAYQQQSKTGGKEGGELFAKWHIAENAPF